MIRPAAVFDDAPTDAADAVLGATPTTARPSIVGMTLLLGTLAAMGPLAIDMYLPSFPTAAAELRVPESAMQATLAAYFVGLAVGQLIYGPAADRWGRRGPLVVGLVLFAIASLGCATAGSVGALVGWRVLQALGGCAEMVIARAVVRDLFGERDAVRVFSGLVLVMGVAPLVAPLTGGWIVGHLGWRAIFWALSAAAVVMLILALTFLGETLPPERRSRHSPGDIAAVYAGLARDRPFMAYAVALGLTSAGLFAYVGSSPLVFMGLFHVTKEHFGWVFGSVAAGLIGMAQVNGALIHRGADPRRVLRAALVVAAVGGVALVAVATTGVGGLPAMYAAIVVCIGCCGFVFPNATALAMAPHGRHAGNASALLGFVQFAVSGVGGFAGSALHATTAVPMAAMIAGCSAGSAAVCLAFAPAKALNREGAKMRSEDEGD